MDEQQAPTPPCAPRQRDTACEVLPAARRARELDAFLRDVEGLRRVLETDLSLAASATEAGALHVASDVVDADRAELARFSERSMTHLPAQASCASGCPLPHASG